MRTLPTRLAWGMAVAPWWFPASPVGAPGTRKGGLGLLDWRCASASSCAGTGVFKPNLGTTALAKLRRSLPFWHLIARSRPAH